MLGHRPIYTPTWAEWPVGQIGKTRAVFEPIFQQYNVDAYISAHIHGYERFDVKDTKNILNIVNGAGGNIEGVCSSRSLTGKPPQPVSLIREWGYGMITITSTSFEYKYYIGNSINQADYVKLLKSNVDVK